MSLLSRDVLRRRLQVPPLDVAVAPLGTPGQPPSHDAVLVSPENVFEIARGMKLILSD